MATPIELPEGDMDATAPDLCDHGMEASDIGDLLVHAGDRLGDCYVDGLPKAPVIRATLTDLLEARVRIDALVAALEGEL